MPSSRGASFTFNEAALRAALRVVDCTHLIRSHCEVAEGIREDIRNKCFTIYSAHGVTANKPRGIFITLQLDSNGNVTIDKSRDTMEVAPVSCEPLDWCRYILHYMQQRFDSDACTYLNDFCQEELIKHRNAECTFGEQVVTHMHLTSWMLDYGIDALSEIKEYIKDDIPPNAKYFPTYFPVIFDKIFGNGGTFRIILNPNEDKIIQKVSFPTFEKFFCLLFALKPKNKRSADSGIFISEKNS